MLKLGDILRPKLVDLRDAVANREVGRRKAIADRARQERAAREACPLADTVVDGNRGVFKRAGRA